MITNVINYDYNLTSLLIISSVQVSLNDQILIILELYDDRQSYVVDSETDHSTLNYLLKACYCLIGHFHKKIFIIKLKWLEDPLFTKAKVEHCQS